MPFYLRRMPAQQSVIHARQYIIAHHCDPAFDALSAQVCGETGHQIFRMTDDLAADHARQVQVLRRQPHVKLRFPASPDQHGAEGVGRRDLLARRILAGAVHHEIRQPQDIAHPIESARSALPDEQMFITACGHRLMNPRPARLVLLGGKNKSDRVPFMSAPGA